MDSKLTLAVANQFVLSYLEELYREFKDDEDQPELKHWEVERFWDTVDFAFIPPHLAEGCPHCVLRWQIQDALWFSGVIPPSKRPQGSMARVPKYEYKGPNAMDQHDPQTPPPQQ